MEDEARRCAAEALEAERQRQEALRCLEACRQHKALRSLEAAEAEQRRRQRQAVRSVEQRRARRAASLGRAAVAAEALVRCRAPKVLRTDVSGLQQLSAASFQVLRGESLEASEQPRAVPAPQPSRAQRQVAR